MSLMNHDNIVRKQKLSKGLLSTKRAVELEFHKALKKAFPTLPETAWEPIISTSNPKFGDYQCNNAMSLFKSHKAELTDCKTPKDVGEKIREALDQSHFCDVIVAPQGFVTVKFSLQWVMEEARQILTAKEISCTAEDAPLSCIIDYSSPNIAKEMHVGHLRTTIHGEAISRILEFVGHKVDRVNHLGDWGTQFGMLIQHMEDVYPNMDEELPNLSDLNAFYKEAKKRFDADEEFKKAARLKVVALQSGDPRARRAWSMLVEISMKEFQKIYDRLGTSKLEARGESFYNDMLPTMVEMLQEKGLVEISDGAKVVWTDPENRDNDIPLIVQKSDGGYGYDSTDTATIYHRLVQTHHDWCLYVTDVGQAGHIIKIFDMAKLMGWHTPPKTRCDHIGLGLVCGDDGKKFKTRSGEVVKLVDLLDEAVDRARAELKARKEGVSGTDASADAGTDATGTDPDATGTDSDAPIVDIEVAARRMGYAAVKYFDLKQQRAGNYKFNYDKMLDAKGNTAVYMMYAYARICAIFRKVGRDEATLDASHLEVIEPEERSLCMTLLKFPEVLELILADFSCHRLCEFMYDLSSVFTEFYQKCRVIGHEKEESRLLLCAATRKMLAVCFYLLGIEPLEQI